MNKPLPSRPWRSGVQGEWGLSACADPASRKGASPTPASTRRVCFWWSGVVRTCWKVPRARCCGNSDVPWLFCGLRRLFSGLPLGAAAKRLR